MASYIIYKAENMFTGEVYVGATSKSLIERRNDHLQKSSKGSDGFFHQAIGAYGSNSFIWTQVDSASSINELAEKETEYIYMYDSFENGYNSDKGGGFKKTVYQYNVETGELINSYDDLISALLFKPQTIVITKSGTIGRLGILGDYMCGNRAVINIKPKEDYNLPLIFFFLKSKYNELVDMAVGSAQANLYVPILASMRINLPDKKDLTHFYLASNSILELLKLKTIENQKLAKLQDLLLARMTRVESEK